MRFNAFHGFINGTFDPIQSHKLNMTALSPPLWFAHGPKAFPFRDDMWVCHYVASFTVAPNSPVARAADFLFEYFTGPSRSIETFTSQLKHWLQKNKNLPLSSIYTDTSLLQRLVSMMNHPRFTAAPSDSRIWAFRFITCIMLVDVVNATNRHQMVLCGRRYIVTAKDFGQYRELFRYIPPGLLTNEVSFECAGELIEIVNGAVETPVVKINLLRDHANFAFNVTFAKTNVMFNVELTKSKNLPAAALSTAWSWPHGIIPFLSAMVGLCRGFTHSQNMRAPRLLAPEKGLWIEQVRSLNVTTNHSMEFLHFQISGNTAETVKHYFPSMSIGKEVESLVYNFINELL